MEGLNRIKKTIERQTRVTLVDRLKNVGENIKDNVIALVIPLVALGAIGGTVALGVKAHRCSKDNEGYAKAYSQVSNIEGVLNSDPNYWQAWPFNRDVFEPVENSIDSSLARKETKEGQEVKDLVGKMRAEFYESETTRGREISLVGNLSSKLKPLAEVGNKYVGLAAITGLLAALATAFSAVAINESDFSDINSDKKRRRKAGFTFLEKLRKSSADGSVDAETIGYLGNFIEGMGIPNRNYFVTNEILGMLGRNLNAKSKSLLRALSENPCYDVDTLDSLCGHYHRLRRADKDSPLNGSRLKSRKDLFLELWARENGNAPRNLVEAINTGLSFEKEIPEMLESLLQGTRSTAEIERIKKFLSRSILPDEANKKLAASYLKNPALTRLPKGDLGVFTAYAGRRVVALPPEESLKLVSELENLRSLADNSLYAGSWDKEAVWDREDSDLAIEIALDTARKNPSLAPLVLCEAWKISQAGSEKKEAMKELYSCGIIPTNFLLHRLLGADDKKGLLKEWEDIRQQIANGDFNQFDQLKRDLEYTHFYREAVSLGKNAGFDSYLDVLGGKKSG